MTRILTVYDGDLRCRLTHGPSSTEILTDAPMDNHGRGEQFSRTDLVAAALGSCIFTVMGITAKKNNINMDGARADVEKEMLTIPIRRIGRIQVKITMPAGIDPAKRELLEQTARTCPVHKSLHPDVDIFIELFYPD